jgi:hypothetical protein
MRDMEECRDGRNAMRKGEGHRTPEDRPTWANMRMTDDDRTFRDELCDDMVFSGKRAELFLGDGNRSVTSDR